MISRNLQHHLAVQTIELGFVKMLSRSYAYCGRAIERTQGRIWQADACISLREQASEPATGEPGFMPS
jgi:hypothetical protein